MNEIILTEQHCVHCEGTGKSSTTLFDEIITGVCRHCGGTGVSHD